MFAGLPRPVLFFSILLIFVATGSAQPLPGKPAPPNRIELGLENAVKWEWRVAPAERDWDFPPPASTPTPVPTPAAVVPHPETGPSLYEVKRGDALVLIGKKFGLTVYQLQTFNGLKGDKIRAGQTLKIPTPAEASALTPAPVSKPKPSPGASPSATPAEIGIELNKFRLQIFLDREQFTTGPIVSDPGPPLTRLIALYQSTHETAKDDLSLQAKAQAVVPEVFTHYKLRAEDFRFIAPPRAAAFVPKPVSSARPGKPAPRLPVQKQSPLSYQEMVAMPVLAYRNPWEFVSERFHCQEAYLRILNDKLPAVPVIGTVFQVPNVVPFEIEKAFDEPLQPQPDPANPVTAAIINRSQLNIYQSGALIAVLPVSSARPGLHGRNSWTVLDAIPHPRLATLQKAWKKELPPKPRSPVSSVTPEPTVSASENVLPSEEYLAPGPRNPVGIFWINLAKAQSSEPLPYGLTGTSIPDRMNVEQSIGGLRLTNWDIARAVRHLPPGTPLEWK